MKDFKAIVKIMAAIHAGENGNGFNVAAVDERVVGVPAKTRDMLALKLQDEGYIKDLRLIDVIDGQTEPVILWEQSKPKITVKGLEYMSENKAFKKAVEEIKDIAVSVASQVVTNTIISKM